ncbi:hypothetical protein G6F40_016483 [Rhizopus arrhizus]|nr:hypothetical protein G6F40_016483 [Rhizopus arrhizus]
MGPPTTVPTATAARNRNKYNCASRTDKPNLPSSTPSTVKAPSTWLRDSPLPAPSRRARGLSRTRLALYQRPIPVSTTLPNNAASDTHATPPCPCGMLKSAASSGPSAEPTLPPTWKSDCARPWRPPEAMRATRDDSG